MNRYKKEQEKKMKADPNYKEPEGATLSEEEWNKLINYYEDNNKYERMQKTFTPILREMDRRAKELKAEGDKEREERLKEREQVEKLKAQEET
ncbi:MAG: hypothetical protein K9K67_11650 [Bacteriovoracaceae bacterium]|nr:hypothetical protein [Bacteriovoracaceae bacterium]